MRIVALSTYLDGRFNQSRAFILTSSPRSGSTWLGQILGVMPKSCTLFEPLHLKEVPEAETAGFSWRTFVNPEEEWPEGETFLNRVFQGKIVNDWTAREMSLRKVYRSNRLIVKFVRANRLLPWICRRFKVPAPILLLRHPCAVIASQLNYGWKIATRPDIPQYLDEYPQFRTTLLETEGAEEYLAALWALDQLPALLYRTPHPWIIVTYEELILRPKETLSKVFEKWNIEIDYSDALSRIKQPSSVVSSTGISGITGWKSKLSADQISRVLSTVNSFGLTFYSKYDEPDYDILFSENLAQQIREVGIG